MWKGAREGLPGVHFNLGASFGAGRTDLKRRCWVNAPTPPVYDGAAHCDTHSPKTEMHPLPGDEVAGLRSSAP